MSEQKTGVSVNLGDEIVTPIVQAQVIKELSARLNNCPDLMQKVIETAMRLKVDRSGKVDRSNDYYNNLTYIQWLCESMIQDVARAAITEWVESHKKDIRDQVVKSLNANKGKLAQSFFEAVTSAAASNYRLKVDVYPVKPS